MRSTKTLRRIGFFSMAGRLTRSGAQATQRHCILSPGLALAWSSSAAPWPDCAPCRSRPDGAIRNRPNASKLASSPRREAYPAASNVTDHAMVVEGDSQMRSRSPSGGYLKTLLPCHGVGFPIKAQAFSLIQGSSLIPNFSTGSSFASPSVDSGLEGDTILCPTDWSPASWLATSSGAPNVVQRRLVSAMLSRYFCFRNRSWFTGAGSR